MQTKQIDVPTTATSLYELLDFQQERATVIGMQAPAANADIVYFGDRTHQVFEIRPKANALIKVISTKAVFIKGTSGDKLSVGIF